MSFSHCTLIDDFQSVYVGVDFSCKEATHIVATHDRADVNTVHVDRRFESDAERVSKVTEARDVIRIHIRSADSQWKEKCPL